MCRATEGGSTAAFGLTAAQAGAMGVPAQGTAGPVTSTSGATRILLLVNCVNREELLDDECAPLLCFLFYMYEMRGFNHMHGMDVGL
jgi:hypothetical protein